MRSSKQKQVQKRCKNSCFLLEEAKCQMETQTGSGTERGKGSVLNLAKSHLLYALAIKCTRRLCFGI